MSNKNWAFTPTEIERAVKTIEKLGYRVRGLKIDKPRQTLEVTTTEASNGETAETNGTASNEVEQWLNKHAS